MLSHSKVRRPVEDRGPVRHAAIDEGTQDMGAESGDAPISWTPRTLGNLISVSGFDIVNGCIVPDSREVDSVQFFLRRRIGDAYSLLGRRCGPGVFTPALRLKACLVDGLSMRFHDLPQPTSRDGVIHVVADRLLDSGPSYYESIQVADSVPNPAPRLEGW